MGGGGGVCFLVKILVSMHRIWGGKEMVVGRGEVRCSLVKKFVWSHGLICVDDT
jgi:hypothetical protein